MDQNNLIVYLEHEAGRVADVSLELLTNGRVLASRLGVKLEAVILGDKLEGIEEQVFPYGVDLLYKVADKRLSPYTSNPHAAVLINLFREIKPQICLMGATCIGRDLGPRVSSCLHSGLTADCTALEIGDHTDPKTGKEYKDLLLQIRPAFGGNIVATIVNPECRPQMATVREGVMKREVFDPAHKGEVVELDAKKYVDDADFVVDILDRHIEQSKINIKNSPIIVAGGYGVGSRRCRCRFHRTCTPDRTNRCHSPSQTLHSMWHLRPDPAYCRYAGQLHHHINQQRSRSPHQHDCRLCDYRQYGGRRTQVDQILQEELQITAPPKWLTSILTIPISSTISPIR